MGFKLVSLVLALVSAAAVSARAIPAEAAAAAAAEHLEERATCVYTCGSVCYWQSDITDALNQGYSDYESGTTPGGYPHQYQDYEGFNFPTSGPWYEFPILSSYTVYTGGSPGPDRVIFDVNGNLDSLITHTGASGNNFVACEKN
ncbi:ribonuclease-domain-containing protein [Diplogelasinospora grovesii]|uniref:ribonuclease T1 n=1 Tax=Diplogelasinospora grovesii TaxID=303347 RepID=A0AAN6S2L1_9PEZI|nr:ribonuclease-domain-containing protein [Diplogelasinospora grovesii]